MMKMKRCSAVCATMLALSLVFASLAFARGGGFSGSRGGSFSGSRGGGYSAPSRRPSAPPPARVAPPPAAPRSGTGSGFSGGSKSGFSSGAVAGAVGAAAIMPHTTHDSGAASAAAHEGSKTKFDASRKGGTDTTGGSGPSAKVAPPITHYDGGAGAAQRRADSAAKFKAANPTVQRNVGQLSSRQYETRSERSRTVYHHYYNRTPPIYAGPTYSDPFGNMFFWMWLMDRPHERDQFIYNHSDSIDPARLAELKKSDAELAARLVALEAGGAVKDPTYVPKDLDPDLMYDDETVKEVVEKGQNEGSGHPILWSLLAITVVGGVCYFGFIRRY